MFHQHTLVPVIDGDLAPAAFAKTLAFNRFYRPGVGSDQTNPKTPLGHVQIMGAMTPELLLAYLPGAIRPFIPKSWLRPLTNNMVLFLVSTEDLPLPSCRISRGWSGRPQLRYTPTLQRAHRALVRLFLRDLRQAVKTIEALDDKPLLGNQTLAQPLPPLSFLQRLFFFQNIKFAANAHQCGTLKMGVSPQDSVTNVDGQVWGLDNLYVTDASVFPSSTHLNPSLTIYANALRVAQGLAAKF